MNLRRFSPARCAPTWTQVAFTLVLLSPWWTAHAQEAAGQSTALAEPSLRSSSLELALAGALVSVEGTTQAQVLARCGPFFELGPGLLALQADVGFSRIRSLEQLDLQATLSWQMRLMQSPVWPYAGIGGGIQQEWLGSFRTARYPLGFDLGLRTVLGTRVGIRTEYRFRRYLDDPVANFNQHQISTGITLYLNNT